MKFFKRIENEHNIDVNNKVTQKEQNVILTKDQTEFNTTKVKEEESEMQVRLITLPSRAYFYDNIPVQIKIRDLLVGEAAVLQEIYKKDLVKRNNISNTMKDRLSSIIFGQSNQLGLSNQLNKLNKNDQEYLDKLVQLFSNRSIQNEYQNSVKQNQNEYSSITTDLIDVFQKCVLTEDVNLRDLTVEDFYYVCYGVLILSCPGGFNFSCSFPRYNIKKMQFNINEYDINKSLGGGLQNNIIDNYTDLLSEWKKSDFTPPLVKHIEIFNNNCYNEELSEETNKLYGLWSKDVSYIYKQYAQFIKGKNVADQLQKIDGPFRKKRKYLSSLMVFKLFYEQYIRNTYSLIKEVILGEYDYDSLEQILEGLMTSKRDVENKLEDVLKNNSDVKDENVRKLIEQYQYEVEDYKTEIKEVKAIKEKCKDVTDAYKMFKSKSLKIRVDLDLPSLVKSLLF